MLRQHQQDVAALEQWTPLIAKLSFKAAQRAAKIGSSLRQEDFQQELSITLWRAMESYDPNHESSAKLITFLHRAFYNEINKLLAKDDRNAKVGFTMSGDSVAGEDDEDFALWGQLECDSERPAEYLAMDVELMDFVRSRVSPEASAIMEMLLGQSPFVTRQLEAYNEGIKLEHEAGGIRRVPLNLDFSFICKMLGFGNAKINKLSQEIADAVANYGV